MEKKFLELYNQELAHLRGVAKEFAEEFPKIASRLQISDFDCEDPYVERLLEGFAFLTARIQKKYQDSFPRFTESILNTVFPISWAPIPSMAILELTPDSSQDAIKNGVVIPRHTSFTTPSLTENQTPCEFLSGMDVTLWPIEIVDFQYKTKELGGFNPPQHMEVNAGLYIKLKNVLKQPFSKLSLDSIPFFVNTSDEIATSLLEHLFADNTGILIKTSDKENAVTHLPSECIKPKGYDSEDALLPNVERRFKGFRLLLEYFVFPARFKFFELTNLKDTIQKADSDTIEILIPLKKRQINFTKTLELNNLKLFCVPVVNIFKKHADRIFYNKSYEYHVIPERTHPRDYEVYSIEKVNGYDEDNNELFDVKNFYHMTDRNVNKVNNFFSVHRRSRLLSSTKKQRTSYVGSEVFLSFSGPDFNEYSDKIRQVSLEIMCTNRDLPLLVDPGKSLSFSGVAGLKVASFLVHPTVPHPPPAMNDNAWMAISHLKLGYTSLFDDNTDNPAEVLKKIIRLYCPPKIEFGMQQIEGITSVKTKNITRRLAGKGSVYFAQGLQFTITFDENAFAGMGCFIFAYIFKEFVTHYVTINSFAEVVIETVQRGEIIRWKPSRGIRSVI